MNLAFVFNDSPRYWTVGSYLKRELAKQDEIDVVAHARIPEDVPIIEEQNKFDIDLVVVVDCSVHYKLHHCKGKLCKKTKTCVWLSDMHRPEWASWRLQMIKEWKYDHVFYAQKNFRDMILKVGYKDTECTYLPHATDSEIFKPMPWIKKRYDIGFVGYNNPKRQSFVNLLKDYMIFKHFDSVWELNAARRLNELKIGFNVSLEDDALNMRSFETMSVGIPLLINRVVGNGMEDFFIEDKDFLAFSDGNELKEKAVRLLANPEMRKIISDSARNKVLAMHTYRNRMNTILGTMGFEMLKNY